jgi:hypothetical protein
VLEQDLPWLDEIVRAKRPDLATHLEAVKRQHACDLPAWSRLG